MIPAGRPDVDLLAPSQVPARHRRHGPRPRHTYGVAEETVAMPAVRNVLVVGGGTAGAGAAILLAKGGVSVDLVELKPDAGAVGSGITLTTGRGTTSAAR
jgi:NADPH-dependent 2,4-dienoyl-CoA reductase/sulfur reductase-like enzyme